VMALTDVDGPWGSHTPQPHGVTHRDSLG
jgi:hypothetical protein